MIAGSGEEAIWCWSPLWPVVSRCRIEGNAWRGGVYAAAVAVEAGGALILRDCLVRDNVASMTVMGYPCTFGLYGGSLTVEGCTIVGNSGGFARLPDDQVLEPHGPLILRNSILWGNPGGPVLPDPATFAAPVEISYCVVEGGCAGTGYPRRGPAPAAEWPALSRIPLHQRR